MITFNLRYSTEPKWLVIVLALSLRCVTWRICGLGMMAMACGGIFLLVHVRTVRMWMMSLLTLLVESLGVELVGHQGLRLVWLRRTNGGAMQLEVLGAIGLFLLRSSFVGAEVVLLYRC